MGKIIWKSSGKSLDEVKDSKITELDTACKNSILGYFKAIVNDIEYDFSYDEQAQSRFSGIAGAFSLGLITEVVWTAHIDDERYRLNLTKNQFISVSAKALLHESTNVEKFNQLFIAVNNASTTDEVSAIEW
jgi:hypothetical protein